MKHIIFSMQFRGTAAPAAEEGVMKANTSATSCSVKTVIGPDGVEGAFVAAEGGMAFFESEVRMTGKEKFLESGTISFGDDHSLAFSTVGEGHMGASADSKLMAGAVTWKIDSGEGQFQSATGFITSNFTLSSTGEVVDYQFGSIFLK